ncbi:MAG: hypothetical protein AAFU67_08460, partial [Bacteroidota bacterium]
FPDEIGNTTFSLAGTANNDKEEEYTFNLADLYAQGIKLVVKSQRVQLEMGTRKQRKFIEQKEEGDLRFINEVTFYFEDVEDAQVVQYAIKTLIPLAEKAYEASLPQYTSTVQAASSLAETLGRAKLSDIEQSLEGGCQVKLNREEVGRSTKIKDYSFDFADLNGKEIKITTSGEKVNVSAFTKEKQRFVYFEEEGETKPYVNEVEFFFPSIAEAKLTEYTLGYLTENCPNEVGIPSKEALLSLLNNDNLEEGNLSQAAELLAGSPCKMQLTQIESTAKKSKDLVYEFNVYDLNPASAKVEVKGTQVTVAFYTNKKEDIVQELENDEKQTYTDGVSFHVADVPTGKQVAAGIAEMAKTCGE